MAETPLIGDLGASPAGAALDGARIGVVTFPGTLDDRDAARAVRLAGGHAVPLWHADDTLAEVDAVVVPGGFSYGDYLRAGAISRFAPLMSRLTEAATAGTGAALPVLGICNGFQILTEAHLLPGSMIKNDHLKFRCADQVLRVENTSTAWTSQFTADELITVPLKNQDGQYVADEDTLARLEGEGRVVFATWAPTRTAPVMTSPASATPEATWWASCRIRSTRWRPATAPRTPPACATAPTG